MLPVCYKFESFPGIIYDFLSKLSPSDYRRASRVCRSWHAAAQSPALIKKMYFHCFHTLPHPLAIKEKGWKVITGHSNAYVRNLRDLDYHLFFFSDSDHNFQSKITRFEVCGDMIVVEKESGGNYVVNPFGHIVQQYNHSQTIFDSFEGLTASMIKTQPNILIIFDWKQRRGSYYFLPGEWKFAGQLKGKFVSKDSLIAYVLQKDQEDHEIRLCVLTWDASSKIAMRPLYSLKSDSHIQLVKKHSNPLQISQWRFVHFSAGNELYCVDLNRTNPQAEKIVEHNKRIEHFLVHKQRILFESEPEIKMFNVKTRKIELTFTPKNRDKIWIRGSLLFEYLGVCKQMIVTNLDKGSIMGKWSVAIPHVPSKLVYTVDSVEYVRDTFFCLYRGGGGMCTVRSFDMRSEESQGMDDLVNFGTRIETYERMSFKDGRLFLMLTGGEGVIVDFNKTPGLIAQNESV